MTTPVGTGLEVEQDPVFQQRERRMEAVGWGVLALFMTAALAGLLGNGPFSWSEAGSADGAVTVQYQRIAHADSDDTLTVAVAPAVSTDGTVEIELSGPWTDAVQVRSISPQPEQQQAGPGVLRFVVAAEPGEPVQLSLSFRANAAGWSEGQVSSAGTAVEFRQLVLP